MRKEEEARKKEEEEKNRIEEEQKRKEEQRKKEEQRRKEKDIRFQIFSKMQENLKKESKEEDKGENIDFNYKLFLSKGLVTNTMKTDPYLDYKEFFQMEKEKQKMERRKMGRKRNNIL